MDTLQKLLEDTIQKAFSTEKILVSILNKKLKEMGIVLSDKQLQQLQNEIKNKKNLDIFNFKIEEEEALEFPSNLKSQATEPISLSIDAEKDLANIADKIGDIIEKLFPEITCETAETILETLRQNLKDYQKYYRKQIKSFNRNIEQIWGKAIDLIEMLYYLSVEAGETFNRGFRSANDKENNFVFDVLSRLHARSCQITAEIILMLRNGFADCAHARWRTLHEIAVITYFVTKHGNDLAERYLCHTAVESYKASIKYQEYCDALGYEKLTPEEFAEIREKYQYYINKYGNSYKQPYGWAATVLAKDNPTFADIEADVDFDHIRPYYKMASYNVHADPQGIFFKLGLIPGTDDVLLTGPSNLGLADPGHCTAISLVQITTNLLTTVEPNFDRLVILKILSTLKDEAGALFYKADQMLKEDIAT